MLDSITDSKKLTGLAVIVLAVLAFFVIYAVVSVWVDVSDTVVVAVTQVLNALGLGHQASQGAVDRAAAQAGTYRVPPPAAVQYPPSWPTPPPRP